MSSNVRLGVIQTDGTLQILQPLSSNAITVNATTDSTSLSTGAITISGGLAISKNMTLGGNMTLSTASTSASSAITLDTPSGTDNKTLTLTSFGSPDSTLNRGAWISLEGIGTTSGGNITLGTTNSLVVQTGATPITMFTISNTGTVSVFATTSSTSISTGALIVSGGIGVAGGVTAGADIVTSAAHAYIGGYLNLYASTTSTIAGTLSLINTTSSTSASTGALVVSGGVGIQGNLTLSGGLSVLGANTVFSATTNSTSQTTGVLVISGGMGIAENVFIGGQVVLQSTTASTSPSTGTLITSGGVGIGGVLSTQGAIHVYNDVGTHLSMYSTLGVLWTSVALETASAHPTIRAYDNTGTDTGLYIRLYRDSGAFEIASTLDATSASGTTGSLRTAGGLSVAKTSYLGGIVQIVNTTPSTSATTGSLIVSGGMGVSGNVFMGAATVDMYNITGTSNSLSIGTAQIMTTSSGYTIFQSGSSRTNGSWSPIQFRPWNATRAIMTIDDGMVTMSGTSDATSATTGALIVSGGIGVSGASYYTSSISADSLINRSATFVIGTTATTLGNSGSSRALSKTTGNILSVNVAGDFTGGVYIDGPQLSTLGSVLVGTNTSLSASYLRIPAGNNFGYLYASSASDGLYMSYNSVYPYGTSAWTLNSATQGTSNIVIGNALVGFYTGAVGVAPTTLHLSIQDGVGSTFSTNATMNGLVSVANTTNSTSSTTGALVVAGGAGVTGNVYIAGTLTLSTQLSVAGNATVYGRLLVSNTTDSTSTSTGALVITGGLGIGASLTLGGNLAVTGNAVFNNTTTLYGPLVLNNTTNSTSPTTGSIVISGGLGVVASTNIGGSLGVTGPSTLSGTLVVQDTTESYTSSSGSFTLAGGIGVGKSIVVGGNGSVTGTLAVTGNATFSGTLTIGSVSLSDDTTGTINVLSTAPGVRIAATNSAKTTVYSNSISVFTLGNTLLDTNNEVLQIGNSGTTSFVILTRSAGTGTTRSLVLQSGGSNGGQVTLNTDGSVTFPLANKIALSANPTNATGGALNLSSGDIVSGGILYFPTNLGNGAAPTLTTRSGGTRIVLYPSVSTTTTDVAIGIVNGTDIWYGAAISGSHAFYAGATSVTSIDSSGTLNTNANVNVGTLANSGSYQLSVLYGATDTVRLAPSTAGATVSVLFAHDPSFTTTTTDGDQWSIGRNLFNHGSTTFGIGMNGPSGQLLGLWLDNKRCVYIPSTIDSTMVGNGALVVSGGASISSSVNIGGNLNVLGTISGNIASSGGSYTSTEDSTSTTTGSLITAGGTGIAKSLYVGGHTVIQATDASTSPTTGALTVTGGVGVSGDVYINGLFGSLNTTDSLGLSSGAVVLAGGISISKNLTCGGNVALPTATSKILLGGASIYTTTGNVLCFVPTSSGLALRDSLDSVSILSYMDGGPVSVSVQTSVTFTGDSTASTTGALIVSGGVGVAKSLHVGLTGYFNSGIQVSNNSVSSPLLLGSITDGTGGSAHVIQALYSSLATGNSTIIEMGTASTAYNSAILEFVQAGGAGSTTNLLSLGLNSVPNVLNVFGTGKVTIGTLNPQTSTLHVAGTGTFTGALSITDTTLSTSTTTGALVVSGGVGVIGNLYAGGNTYFNSNVNVGSTLTSATVSITSTTDATLLGQGSLVTSGGASISATLQVGGELSVVGGTYLAALTTSGTNSFTSTIDSTSTTSGAMVLAGGLGVAKNVYLGANLTLTSSSTITSAYLTLTENVTSTSPSSGTLVCNGGIGIGGNAHIAGIVSINNTTASTSYTTGALVVNGGLGVSGAIYNDSDIVSTGAITSVSDRRVKYDVRDENFDDINYLWQKLMSIPVKRYKMYKDIGTENEDKEYVGVIAQVLQDHFPDLVHEDANGMLSVDYSKMFLYWILYLQSSNDPNKCLCKRT